MLMMRLTHKLIVGCTLVWPSTARAVDSFDRLSQINKASIVMLSDTGLVPNAMAARIARGIEAVMADEAKPGARRSSDYLVFEALLEKASAPDASRLHTGRSRQDIAPPSPRIACRYALLS